MERDFHVLCAGAVKGLVVALQAAFEQANGLRLHGRYGAVSAMRDELRAGAPCDVFIATEAMVAALASSGELRRGTSAPIGLVRTAIAVRAEAPRPAIDSPEALKATLLAASALHFPDATRSTAGAHVVSMLERLDLRQALALRLRMHANGATAMRELAARGDDSAIGCTQATEIRYTPGIALVGALPPPFALATVYSAAIGIAAQDEAAARSFVDLLTGASSAELRRLGGFEPAPS